MGVYDAMNLSELILNNSKNGRDIGDLHNLKAYESKSKQYNTALAYFEQGLITANTNWLPANIIRNAGYGLISNISPLRDLLQNIADGDQFVPSEWPWSSSIPDSDDPLS